MPVRCLPCIPPAAVPADLQAVHTSCSDSWLLVQGKVALLGNRGHGGMLYGHVLSYKADAALQLELLRALAPTLETLEVTGDLVAPKPAAGNSDNGSS